MGLFDAILGRSKPPEADLDVLFAVPQAVLSLQANGFEFAGTGSVCFRDAEGAADDAVVDEAEQLVSLDGVATVERTDDAYGFHWLTVTRPHDAPGLCTDLHAVNSGLVEAGFGSTLLCSTVVLTGPAGGPVGLVYLFKRGTFYPFVPLDGQRRDNALELQIRGIVAGDVPVESDLSRWMAIWGAPHLG